MAGTALCCEVRRLSGSAGSTRPPSLHAGEPGHNVVRMGRTRIAPFVVTCLVIVGGACSSSPAATHPQATRSRGATAGPSTARTGPGAPSAVVKDVLASDVDPPGAPGKTLTLIRYTIPAAAKLAPHTHPGVQLASIQSGTLTYTVVSGTIPLKHRDGTTENLVGPTTTKLHAGDVVTEVDGVVHYGADDTTQPVVILATLLTRDGKDLAVPVAQPGR
jgi:quercetin dioxygenase-like cupin family protein